MTQTLFVSYSHKDESYKDYVVSHLGIAEKQGLLETWDDRRIKQGEDWREEIRIALARAKVSILLVSRHSLTSDFILNEEVSAMLRIRDQEGLVVYPIVIRACDWDAVDWLKSMNLRPTNGKPLARFTLDRRDEVMAGISREIRGLLEEVVETTTPRKALDPSPVDDEIDRLAEQTEALSDELGTTKVALNGMFEILAEQRNISVDKLEAKLREIAASHLELAKNLQELSKFKDEPQIAELRELAAEAIEEGDYNPAYELLAKAAILDRRTIQELQEALDQRKQSAVATISQQADLESTRLNYRTAAKHFAEAATLVLTSDSDTRLDCLTNQARMLYKQGRELGDNSALTEAIDTCRHILKSQVRECVPLDWAKTQRLLGAALLTLGERETGADKLKQAVKAYRASLDETSRERVPLDWAEAQMGLGIAFQILGDRKGRDDELKQAISAYQAALEERKRDRVPLQWAQTKVNLGSALLALGGLQNSTAKLKQAIGTFTAALKEITRDRAPFDWAATQTTLGNALTALGDRKGRVDKLEQAVSAHQAALEERKRDRVPLQWAQTKVNLGRTLLALGERQNSTAKLKQAIGAFTAALKEITRDRAPFDWANAQMGLGMALRAMGELTGCKDHLENALRAMRNASDVYLGTEQFERQIYIQDCIDDLETAVARTIG